MAFEFFNRAFNMTYWFLYFYDCFTYFFFFLFVGSSMAIIKCFNDLSFVFNLFIL